ncbi:MAG: hypothetical protein JSR46_10215 [Verrucomicrobia bacterium]|nr:hypothetical protein [Verrucomicrobiota bacterium]
MSPITQTRSRWYSLGIFQGPEETLESYERRAHLLASREPSPGTEAARAIVQACYEADPLWVEVLFSDEGLQPWEAGCTWYSSDHDQLPQIQLRRALQRKKRYLWLYDRDEILAHEYVHAMRAPLNSTLFEEFFAYFTSQYAGKSYVHYFRAFVGPVFAHPREPFILIAAVMGIVLLLVTEYSFWGAATLMIATPLFFLGRLILRWRTWYRCKRRIDEAAGQHALALMARLSDEEIVRLSHMSQAEAREWLQLNVFKF